MTDPEFVAPTRLWMLTYTLDPDQEFFRLADTDVEHAAAAATVDELVSAGVDVDNGLETDPRTDPTRADAQQHRPQMPDPAATPTDPSGSPP